MAYLLLHYLTQVSMSMWVPAQNSTISTISLNIICGTLGVRLFLAKENHTLLNHAMVSTGQFRVDDFHPHDGISDAIWCQAAPSLGVVHYQWYGPGGDPIMLNTTLDNMNAITNSTTFVVLDDAQVGLARPIGIGIGDNEGLYQCVITADNGTQHTLVVGVYRTSTYKQNSECEMDVC